MAKAGEHNMVACKCCGNIYRQSRSDQMFCSTKCNMFVWRSRQPVAPPITRNCKFCNASFIPTFSNSKYCSEVCAQAGDKARLQSKNSGAGKGWSKGQQFAPRQTCEICGGQFRADPARIIRGGGKFCSNACRGEFIATHPDRFPANKSSRGNAGKREDLNNQFFRSSWEANYARILNFLMETGIVTTWEYEPVTFKFEAIKRGNRFYTPDFRVTFADGKQEFHEIKGWMDPQSQTKLTRMAKYHPEFPILLIDKHAYRSLAEQFSGFIEHWEGKQPTFTLSPEIEARIKAGIAKGLARISAEGAQS